MEAKTVTHEEFNKIRLYSNTVSLVVAMVTALGVGFGFYYNTKTTLESNTIEIKDIKDEVKGIKFQIQDIEKHDISMDYIITPKRVYDFTLS